MRKIKNIIVLSCFTAVAFSCGQKNAETQGEFYVRGNCGMCEERIENAAKALEGVSKADWSVETKSLHVSYDSTKVSQVQIQKAVANVGHETKTETSPEAVHNALPECCKKGGNM